MTGLTVSFPQGESLLLVWPDGTQTKLESHGLIEPDLLWLTMPNKLRSGFLKNLGLRHGQASEPFPGVRMTLIQRDRQRVNIQAPRELVTVLRGESVRGSLSPT